MKLNSLLSFFKKNSESNSEDTLQTSFASRSSSAWSYSYDVHITKRWEEAMKMDIKYEHSKLDAGDKHSSGSNLVEDLDDEFIFESHPQIHAPTTTENIASPASGVPNNKNQKNRTDYIPDSTRNLKPPFYLSLDESLSDVDCVRFSRIQKPRLSGITGRFSKDNNEEIKPKLKEKLNKFQIQAGLIEYLLQFIHKTALPALHKYDHLQRKYCNEKKEWTERFRFLERQNSVLKSALQTADSSFRDNEEKDNNFKTFYSPIQHRFTGNYVHDPALRDIERIIDFNLAALTMPDVKPCLSFGSECTWKKEELVDLKLGCFRQVSNVELDRNPAHKADKVKFYRKLQQETFRSSNIFPMSNNKIVSDGSENEYDSAPFWSGCVNAHQERHIELTSSEEDNLAFVVGGSSYASKPDEEEAVASQPCAIGWAAGTKLICANPDLLTMKEKTMPKTVFIDPEILALSDSWYLRKKDRAADTVNTRSLKVGTEGRLNCQKTCQISKPESRDSGNQHRMFNIKLNNSILASPMKSMWL